MEINVSNFSNFCYCIHVVCSEHKTVYVIYKLRIHIHINSIENVTENYCLDSHLQGLSSGNVCSFIFFIWFYIYSPYSLVCAFGLFYCKIGRKYFPCDYCCSKYLWFMSIYLFRWISVFGLILFFFCANSERIKSTNDNVLSVGMCFLFFFSFCFFFSWAIFMPEICSQIDTTSYS